MIDYNYYLQYPTLIKELLIYFSKLENSRFRNVLNFCSTCGLKKANDPKDNGIIQPTEVNEVCEILSKYHVFAEHKQPSINGFSNMYYCAEGVVKPFIENWEVYKYYFNTLVYGFQYLYYAMSDNVLPVVFYRKDGDISIGTCFNFLNGIVTCKHCIEGAKNISIKGYKGDFLNSKTIMVSSDDNVDLAFIPNANNCDYILYEDGKILDEIVTMGYPKLPGYIDFLNIEKATISSKGREIVLTKGSISSINKNYLSKIESLLITARIRGGNSGGPIFNRRGFLVGVACETLGSEGDYDDMGYGIAIKSSELFKIIQGQNVKELSKPQGYFVDFDDSSC